MKSGNYYSAQGPEFFKRGVSLPLYCKYFLGEAYQLDRVTITVLLLSAFIVIVALGPFAIIAFLIVVETKVVQELFSLTFLESNGNTRDKYAWISWYFYVIATLYVIPMAVMAHFEEIGFGPMLSARTWHQYTLASFCAYCFGFICSVHAMNTGSCRHELQRFCWTHMAILWTIVQTYFVIRNILAGLIWFVLPVVLVVCNDIFAFLCGRIFGKTPLCKLSPKKTLEGFVGAAVITVLISIPLTCWLERQPYILCPTKTLNVTLWNTSKCTPSAIFMPIKVDILPSVLKSIAENMLNSNISLVVKYSSFQGQAFVLALFASTVAPYGGFLASAIKRTYQVKNFARVLGEHGGVSDRTDCQLLIGAFTRLCSLAINGSFA